MSYYGTDPLSRYQQTLTGPQTERPGSRSISGYDAFGNPLRGQYVSGDIAEKYAQDKLYAQLTGATAGQLLGKAGGSNNAFLRPEQMEALLRLRERFGGGDNATMAANLSAPGMGLPASLPDASGMSIPRGIGPKGIAIALGAVLLLALLKRR